MSEFVNKSENVGVSIESSVVFSEKSAPVPTRKFKFVRQEFCLIKTAILTGPSFQYGFIKIARRLHSQSSFK